MEHVFLYDNGGKLAAYQEALVGAGLEVMMSKDLALAANCAGLLLPGGGDIHPRRYGQEPQGVLRLDLPREEAEFALTKLFLATRKPILGICLGMQLLNVALGGDLRQFVPAHAPVAGDEDLLHATRLDTAAPLGLRYGMMAVVNSYHTQAVGRLGCGLSAIQWAEDGVVEGVCHERLPLLGVQWHPERLRGSRRRVGAVDGGAVFAWLREQIREDWREDEVMAEKRWEK